MGDDIAREHLKSLDDTGVVYYRHSSKILISPPGYERQCQRKVQNLTLVDWNEGSLYSMCQQCILQNIDKLDSLVGLPDIIGKQLFDHIERKRYFEFEKFPFYEPSSDDEIRLNVLQIFNEAYEDTFLTSVALCEIPKSSLGYLERIFPVFVNVSDLDLSGSCLPNNVLTQFSYLTA